MLKILVIGHLGKDATVNNVSGKNVINFSVAHSENYTNAKGEKVSTTTWVECARWGDNTNVAPYLKKGTQVYVEGYPEVHTYQRNDGTTAATLKCRVAVLQLLGGNKQESGGGNSANTAQPASNAAGAAGGIEEKEDLPF